MSKQHGARQQKRLAKQKAKRRARRQQLAVRNSSNPAIRLKAADQWPSAFALEAESLWETGIGPLLLARRAPEGKLGCAMFLVDVFCLGVKDAFWKIATPAEFQTMRQNCEAHGRLREVSPEHLAKLVYKAVDYAQSFGFPPHRDFRQAGRLLAGIDPTACPDEFRFGQDGCPLYVRGPYESLEEARRIAAQISAAGGNFMVGLDACEASLKFDGRLDTNDAWDEDDEYDEFEEDDLEHEESEVLRPRTLSLPWQ